MFKEFKHKPCTVCFSSPPYIYSMKSSHTVVFGGQSSRKNKYFVEAQYKYNLSRVWEYIYIYI